MGLQVQCIEEVIDDLFDALCQVRLADLVVPLRVSKVDTEVGTEKTPFLKGRRNITPNVLM